MSIPFVLPLVDSVEVPSGTLVPTWQMAGKQARCPVCEKVVTVTDTGSVRHGKGEGARCRNPAFESDAHERTKDLLKARIEQNGWLLVRALGTVYPFDTRPPNGGRVVFEYPLDIGLGLDVAVLTLDGHGYAGTPFLALEICDTSPILPLKAAALRRDRVPWIEIKSVAEGDLPPILDLITWDHPILRPQPQKPRR